MDIFDSVNQTGQARQSRAKVLVFTSGKGGVGKTCITTNVATAMARKGARVCIFDADTGLANINILLGLRPEYTLEHVLSGEKNMSEVIVYSEDGLAVVPGASGIAECANLNQQEAQRLVAALAELESEFDYLLIDTAAGIADNVIQFIESAPFAFLIITSEPTSLTDGFSLLKLLNARNYSGCLRVIVNQTADYTAATETYRRFSTAVNKYIKLNIDFGGFVARDEQVVRSIATQRPLVDLAATANASRCMFALADNIMKYIGSSEANNGFSDYWKNLLADNETDHKMADITAPASIQVPTFLNPDVSGDELAKKMLASLKNQGSDQEVLESFIGDFVSQFVARFGSFPKIFSQLFYRWLEAENYPAARMIELVATLEALYISSHQQPMFSVEDSAARLVAQSRGSEKMLRGLVEQLRSSYRQTFQADVFDAQQELLDTIRENDFTEERYEALLSRLHEAYMHRFNRPYRGQSDLLLESTAEALQAIAEGEMQLQAEMAKSSERLQQFATRHQALLTAIGNAQNQHLNLNSTSGKIFKEG
ncbi:MAG: MinD/ParA family protein [Methylomonas sp.]